MRYRTLGGSGLKISEIVLGCARFGEIPDDDAQRLIGAALDLGISTFDTADAYNGGRSEEVLGKAVRARRDQVVICTKVGLRVGDDERGHTATMLGTLDHAQRWSEGIGPNEHGLSRAHLRGAVEASLRRLGTDRIDLYQVHKFDTETPLEETLSTLDDLVRAGKIRYIGCSAFAAWQLYKALWVSDACSYATFTSMQVPYNVTVRDVEREVLPAMRAAAVGGLAFQVLAGGMLSGRFRADESPAAKTRMGSRAIYRSRYWNESSFATVERLRAVSAEAGRTPSALAIAWVLSRPGIGGVLFGASNAAQLDDAASASAEPMEVSESAAVDAAVAP